MDRDFDHFGELRVALAAAAHIAGVDTVFRQRLGAGRVRLEQLVTVEVKVADDGHVNAHLREPVADVRYGRGAPRRC